MTKKASGLIHEIFPHIYLLSTGWDALEKGEKSEEGSVYSFLTAMIFTAFAIEAYLNEVSEEKFPNNWKDIERKSSHNKLLKLCQLENYEIDLKKRPFNRFKEIFDFRNSVAHAKKPEKYERDEIEFNERGIPKLPNWEVLENCNFQNAKEYLDDTEEMIAIPQQELKVETVSNFSGTRSSWWSSNVDAGNSES
jgi:hypothetical protein